MLAPMTVPMPNAKNPMAKVSWWMSSIWKKTPKVTYCWYRMRKPAMMKRIASAVAVHFFCMVFASYCVVFLWGKRFLCGGPEVI